MRLGNPSVLSLVERGWRASRECALDLQAQQINIIHVIKGQLSREVQALIHPYQGIRIISVPRWSFWLAAFGLCCALAVRGRLRAVLVDNERSWRRCRRWLPGVGFDVVRVQESSRGYELWTEHQPVDRAAWASRLHGDGEEGIA